MEIGVDLANFIPRTESFEQRTDSQERFGLTAREWQILVELVRLYEEGRMADWRAIAAARIGIEQGTLKRHIENIRGKIGLSRGPKGISALVLWVRDATKVSFSGHSG